MINLKRNRKGEKVTASGLRVRKNSIYTPGQEEDFKVSRSKFNDFLLCQRCFYLDRVKGVVSPSMPGWSLNETTDILLKKEFDVCREFSRPHRIFLEQGLDDVIPFSHDDLDKWRSKFDEIKSTFGKVPIPGIAIRVNLRLNNQSSKDPVGFH